MSETRKDRCLLGPIDSHLHAACDKNDPYLVCKLLTQGAQLESQDPLRNYRTPLIRAALTNSYEIVAILLLSNHTHDLEWMYLCDDQG
jgi:ankyrin repeat protein